MVDRVRAAWLAAEGSWSTDPDADGSDYLALQVTALGYGVDASESVDLGGHQSTGRNAAPDRVTKRGGGSIDFTSPLQGYSPSVGDGASLPAYPADALDLVFDNSFCQRLVSLAGEGVDVASTVSAPAVDAQISGLAVGMPLPVFYADGRVRWSRVTVLTGGTPYVYTVSPNYGSAPLGTSIVPGQRIWGQYNGLNTQSATLAGTFSFDGNIKVGLGGRMRSLSISANAGADAMIKGSIAFNSLLQNQGAVKTNLPAHGTYPVPSMLMQSSFHWGTTAIATRSVEVNFGLASQGVDAGSGDNGRSDDQVLHIDPIVTIEPLSQNTDGWEEAKVLNTTLPILVQIGGAGAFATPRANSHAFGALRAQVESVSESADGGYTRKKVSLRVVDSGGAGLLRWFYART